MRRTLLTVLVLICAAALLLAGCVVRVTGTGATLTDNGSLKDIPQIIMITEGSTFNIALDANPTTGYTWIVEIADETALELTDSNYAADASETVGSGGVTTLSFTALKQGSTAVHLKYAQDWDGGDTGTSKTITIIVE